MSSASEELVCQQAPRPAASNPAYGALQDGVLRRERASASSPVSVVRDAARDAKKDAEMRIINTRGATSISFCNYYFLLPISRESIVFGSNFRGGDFDGLTRFEVP